MRNGRNSIVQRAGFRLAYRWLVSRHMGDVFLAALGCLQRGKLADGAAIRVYSSMGKDMGASKKDGPMPHGD